MATASATQHRMQGLDFARFLAFVGMVIVNFRIVMGAEGGDGWLDHAVTALEGKAAATFVILAGIGLGLSARFGNPDKTALTTVKRALFLLVIGLLNRQVFPADILHNYAFFFLIGVFFLPLSVRQLVAIIIAITAIAVCLFLRFDYDAGWNWAEYSYADFYAPGGFVRHLFFNGWHPVFPWLAFLVYGIILSRWSLDKVPTQLGLAVAGVLMVTAAAIARQLCLPYLSGISPELVYLASTSPIPPMPLYLLSASGVATSLIGCSLLAAKWLSRCGVLAITAPAGRQTLTLYIAHILLGMGLLEAMGLMGEQSIEMSVVAAAGFCTLAAAFAYFWSKSFKRGPIEMLMRKLVG